MKWIVGLGNPGSAYAQTRHNVGFMVVDALAARHGLDWKPHKCKALAGEGRIAGEKVFLLKPTTYMNLSGEAVRAFLDYYKADLANGIVVYDDLDTEIGRIRLRYQGSAGGHNGIKSIIAHTGTQQFNRIRMGISRPAPGERIVDYVLSKFTSAEREPLQHMIEQACDALEFAITHPYEATMGKYNR
ncbi:aminoacyl-tRNA hydrolase [Paenibacillus sp. IB182496]|uniref:Peptidyl-tRNA hydrolase n=1 Tax=Paenibacillus sabuli TaxID=2772509 RepID=A0A927GUF7_9BACL|nr:aminoacyl-tRNA hydrolase [Paenibacillus sabuli]MBD2848311.1 aminoacyl-tRNA hydrolase [Paenibacillus sabuli]